MVEDWKQSKTKQNPTKPPLFPWLPEGLSAANTPHSPKKFYSSRRLLSFFGVCQPYLWAKVWYLQSQGYCDWGSWFANQQDSISVCKTLRVPPLAVCSDTPTGGNWQGNVSLTLVYMQHSDQKNPLWHVEQGSTPHDTSVADIKATIVHWIAQKSSTTRSHCLLSFMNLAQTFSIKCVSFPHRNR